jgi:anti-anti-sigma regulatory factor
VRLYATGCVTGQQRVALMTQDAAAGGHVALTGALTIRTIETVHATLREAIAQHCNVSIDCTAATEVDLSFIQLLVAARTSARRSDNSVVLAACPDGALLDALTQAGFRVSREDQPSRLHPGGLHPGEMPPGDIVAGEVQTFWFEAAGT